MFGVLGSTSSTYWTWIERTQHLDDSCRYAYFDFQRLLRLVVDVHFERKCFRTVCEAQALDSYFWQLRVCDASKSQISHIVSRFHVHPLVNSCAVMFVCSPVCNKALKLILTSRMYAAPPFNSLKTFQYIR